MEICRTHLFQLLDAKPTRKENSGKSRNGGQQDHDSDTSNDMPTTSEVLFVFYILGIDGWKYPFSIRGIIIAVFFRAPSLIV